MTTPVLVPAGFNNAPSALSMVSREKSLSDGGSGGFAAVIGTQSAGLPAGTEQPKSVASMSEAIKQIQDPATKQAKLDPQGLHRSLQQLVDALTRFQQALDGNSTPLRGNSLPWSEVATAAGSHSNVHNALNKALDQLSSLQMHVGSLYLSEGALNLPDHDMLADLSQPSDSLEGSLQGTVIDRSMLNGALDSLSSLSLEVKELLSSWGQNGLKSVYAKNDLSGQIDSLLTDGGVMNDDRSEVTEGLIQLRNALLDIGEALNIVSGNDENVSLGNLAAAESALDIDPTLVDAENNVDGGSASPFDDKVFIVDDLDERGGIELSKGGLAEAGILRADHSRADKSTIDSINNTGSRPTLGSTVLANDIVNVDNAKLSAAELVSVSTKEAKVGMTFAPELEKRSVLPVNSETSLAMPAEWKALSEAVKSTVNAIDQALALQTSDKSPVNSLLESRSSQQLGSMLGSKHNTTAGAQVDKTFLTQLGMPVENQQWSSQLGQKLSWMVQNGIVRADLRLNPAELGPVNVRVESGDDGARVMFVAHHAQTKDAIEQASSRLRDLFSSEGLDLLAVDVESGSQSFAESSDSSLGGDESSQENSSSGVSLESSDASQHLNGQDYAVTLHYGVINTTA